MLKQFLKFKEAIFYFVVIFSTFVWLLMQIVPQISELVKTEQKIQKRTVEYEKVSKKLEKIREEAKSKKEEEAERVKTVYKPEITFETADTEYLMMIDDILNMIKDNGVRVYSIDYNYDVKTDEIVSQSNGKYFGCQMKIAIISGYHQLQSLLMDLIKYPYLITLNGIETEPYDNNQKYLLSVITFTIYSEQ